MVLLIQLLWNGLEAGAVYALMSFGFALIYFTTRVLHFAHGAIAILLAYCVYVLSAKAGLAWPYAAALALPIGFVLGAGFEPLVYGIVRRRAGYEALPGGSLFIASLGIALVITNVLPLGFGSGPVFLKGGPLASSVLVWGNRIALTHISLVTVPTTIIVLTLAVLALAKTDYGRMVRAVIDDVDTARLIGLRVSTINAAVLGVGTMFAVGVGLVQLLSAGANSQIGNSLMITTIAAAVIGGLGSIPGSIIAGFLVGVLSNVVLIRLPTAWGDGIIYVLLLCFIALRPQGILGSARVVQA
jgi:branched-chain amino acid transport system permease protein